MKNPERLKNVFKQIDSKYSKDYLKEIAQSICDNSIDRITINKILKKHSIDNYKSYKSEFLDIILDYIGIVLNDDIITEDELSNCDQLKLIFKIEEGDFYKYKFTEINKILLKQLFKLYLDNTINKEEALQKVAMQKLFDLSYDQFNEFDLLEAELALKRGADISELDIFIKNFSRKK